MPHQRFIRGVSALDAAADARLRADDGASAPRYAVDQAAPFERLPERLAAVDLVGEIALLVALDQRGGVVDIGEVISACRTRPLSSPTARCAL
jgi:hypothetical protein